MLLMNQYVIPDASGDFIRSFFHHAESEDNRGETTKVTKEKQLTDVVLRVPSGPLWLALAFLRDSVSP